MKKKAAIKVAGSVLVVGAVFAAGTFTGASTDWKTTAINNAYSELLDTGNNKTEVLVDKSATDINNTINTAISDNVDAQQVELQKLLDQYYKMKLEGLTLTPEFKALEAQIETIKANVLANFKKQIDEAFVSQGQ